MIERKNEILSGSGIWSGYLIGYEYDNKYSERYLKRAAASICAGLVNWREIVIMFSDSELLEGKSGFVVATNGIYGATKKNGDPRFAVSFSDIESVTRHKIQDGYLLYIHAKDGQRIKIDHPYLNKRVMRQLILAMRDIALPADDFSLDW